MMKPQTISIDVIKKKDKLSTLMNFMSCMSIYERILSKLALNLRGKSRYKAF